MEKITVSGREAREILGISAEDMKKLLDSGVIPAMRRGNRWHIPVKSLEEYVITQSEKEAWERRLWCQT